MRARWNLFAIVAGVTLVGFAAAALILYRGRPTPGALVLLLGWAALLGTAYFMARAVAAFDLARGASVDEITLSRRDELEREKKLLLKAIKEVEFDRDTGKLDGGEAAEAIARYRARALELLRLLDEQPLRRHEAAIEKELARRLATPAASEVPLRCPSCGTSNDEDATFCKKCGLKLGGAA